jgi:predicted nucleic acid-binding protein
MTVVDTCVWIDHLRHPDLLLADLLTAEMALVHAFVIGELASGTLRNRRSTLATMRLLPVAPMAREEEVHNMIESQRLWGLGLGWVDLHLLASALISRSNLLTDDRRLAAAARKLGIAYPVQ